MSEVPSISLNEILNKEDWTGFDLYKFREKIKTYLDMGKTVPLTRDWFLSSDEAKPLWIKTVKLMRNVAMLIGDVDGFNPSDGIMRSSLEAEVDRLIEELEKAGANENLKKKDDFTLGSLANDPVYFIKYFAGSFVQNLPHISLSQHLNNSLPYNSQENTTKISLIKSKNTSKGMRDWAASSGIIHVYDHLFDCNEELVNGFKS